MSIDLLPLAPLPGNARGVRTWLIEGGDPNTRVDGRPLWAWMMEKGSAQGVAELLGAGADPNQRTGDGRGWLHWCADTGQPEWLAIAGMALLGEDWCRADKEGRTPFHLGTLPAGVGQALAARWWSEGRIWDLLDHPETPEAAAVRAGNPVLARVWRGWEHALRTG